MKKILALTLVCVSLLGAQPITRPKLVIFFSIDQMRADYLERFADQFTGGFKKLSTEGIVYTNADLNYSGSWTGAGHASLSTGSYPHTSGIISNEWIDPVSRKRVHCVGDANAKPIEGEGGGYSPRNLLVTTIGDWLKSVSPESKVISMSGKERAAILMGGHHANYAFWYDRTTGHMVASDYYVQHLPEWAKAFNGSGWIDKNVPDAWTKLMPESTYAADGPDEFEAETKWGPNTSFPHVFQRDKKKEQLLTSPYGDLLVLDFAREAFRAEQLGQRNVTDLLCVDLSCTDYIGHDFGPNSHEMHDHLLRLDRALGNFLNRVEQLVGAGKVLVALSADHAVLALPEYLTQFKHEVARRIDFNKQVKPRIEALDRSLQKKLGIDEPLIQLNAFLNYTAAAKVGIDSLTLEKHVREGLLKIDGIVDVYFRRELANPKTPPRPYLGHFQRSYYSSRGEDFEIRYCENCLVIPRSTGTSHGTPYRYDTHVPVVLWGENFKGKRVERTVYTVDIVPTLAKILGLSYPKTVEGTPLKEVIDLLVSKGSR